MGLYFGMRGSIAKNAGNYEREKVNQFDPNPSIFTIKRVYSQNGNTAILINYPNCKNYEGNKIIVYKGVTLEEVERLNEIDPHFTNEVGIKPFARFEPTIHGWQQAKELVDIL